MNLSEIEKINLNMLSDDEKKSLIKNTYEAQSYFQQLFHNDHVELNCQENSSAFRTQIERILVEKNLIKESIPLENLHEVLSDEMKAYNINDGVNKISTYFYDTDASFTKVYHQYIKYLRENFVKESFWFQETPTIRIHCPKGKNNHHYPRYHSDISYGHPPEEINIWLPLTELLDGHSFQRLSVDASKNILKKFDFDFNTFIHAAIHDANLNRTCESAAQPVKTAFGEMLAFDYRGVHSGETMKLHTRISMDIRILPLSQYKKMNVEYQGSGRRKILFTPGNCYYKYDSDHLLNITGS